MALVRWEPLREIEDMFDRYSRAMGLSAARGQEAMEMSDWTPRVDIGESEDAFVIKAEIPEVQKEDVRVKVDNGVLSISGERKMESEESGRKMHRVERHYGRFVRSFTLPENVDDERIQAAFKDGMLTLSIPKSERAKPKSIEVKLG